MRCAVLGSPIAHSLSPVMHLTAYAELGIDWDYEAIDVTTDQLASFLDSRDDSWRGLSVTAPLKRSLVGLLDEVSDDVELLGVANTAILGDKRTGFNTDVPGGLNALREAGVDQANSARVLGGGATAASMTLTLARLGVRELEVVVRDPARAGDVVELADRCGIDVEVSELGTQDRPRHGVDVLVSTIPASAVDPGFAKDADAIFDAIYDPWPTPLALAADERGIPVVNGLDLLAHQAALQVHLMTGGTVRPSLLRGAAVLALENR